MRKLEQWMIVAAVGGVTISRIDPGTLVLVREGLRWVMELWGA